ncbi:hypothetical protein SAY86_008403 [Trapa natans]|uniref:Outer envelope protein 61 n=1 Tax=Trapa natans TaxID=22666 RepID=A0AAN7QEG3_TRANT|nr:hypothetical protein SAY86_008403 [Trapa natans]
MFNGMIDPDLFKVAQEQMSRMSSVDLVKMQQQMMSNPDLMRMATESMKNMRPEELKHAAEQLRHVRPEELAEIGEKMSKASPEEIAAMRARADARMIYQLNAAEMLKKEGNRLHNEGKFYDASQKYLLAKQNLKDILSPNGKALLQACSLNLMSCYLKTRQFDDCIREGTEVLTCDAKNVKALYRRGQALKEMGQLEDAVHDLSDAHEVSPNDKTIAEVLRDSKERLAAEGGGRASRGLIITEITEEDEVVSSTSHQNPSVEEHSQVQLKETNNDDKNQNSSSSMGPVSNSEALQALKDNPVAIRSFQTFISKADPNTLSAIDAGNPDAVSPEMLKAASNMISKMSPDELQKMIQLASSFQGDNPFSSRGPSNSDSNGFRQGSILDVSPDMVKTATDTMSKMSADELQRMFEMTSLRGEDPSMPSDSLNADRLSSNGFNPGSIPDVPPDMLKTASNVMSKMSPEDLQRMFKMASSLRGEDLSIPSASLNADGRRSRSSLNLSNVKDVPTISRNYVSDETSSSGPGSSLFPPPSNFPETTPDLQEHMRNQMKDPAMQQMYTNMVKNMSPEMMASMGEQFGFKLSREDAERAQQAISSLSPEDLDWMMRWADRIQRGVDTMKNIKNWLLGRPGTILAICMLILSMILHRLGYIG